MENEISISEQQLHRRKKYSISLERFAFRHLFLMLVLMFHHHLKLIQDCQSVLVPFCSASFVSSPLTFIFATHRRQNIATWY